MPCLRILCLLLGLVYRIYQVDSGRGLTVTPLPSVIESASGSAITLSCVASHSPSICLWRTPYQAIYTVGGGRVWEKGRLTSSLLAESHQCGLTIDVLEARDGGVWQCEVGAVVEGDFTTTTASTTVTVTESVGQHTGLKLLRLLGEETVLPCSSSSSSSLIDSSPGTRSIHITAERICRWTTPYNRTYSLNDDEYEERGRLQRSGSQDCNLRVASLQSRDQGQWVCQVGHSGTHTLQAKPINLKLESPLKLSAPTSILQHADERATLVCHANKQYDNCQWTTPYKVTYQFDNNQHQSHEQGRLQYFGFSSMDCGIVIRGLGTRDSGGWTCRVSAMVAGQRSNSTDIVRLFVEPKKFEAVPLSEEFGSDYILDYKATEYDAFDYVNGDFDKVGNKTFVGNIDIATVSIALVQNIDSFNPENTARSVSADRRFNSRSKHKNVEESLQSENLPIFPAVFNKNNQDSDITTGVNPRELEFLERISGSRIDNRPIRIDGEEQFGTKQSNNPEKKFQFGQVKIELEDNSEGLNGNINFTNQHRSQDQIGRIQELIDQDKNVRISQIENIPWFIIGKGNETHASDVENQNARRREQHIHELKNTHEKEFHHIKEESHKIMFKIASDLEANNTFVKNNKLNTKKIEERRLLQTKREQHHFQELQRRREEAKQKEEVKRLKELEEKRNNGKGMKKESNLEVNVEEKEKEKEQMEHKNGPLFEEQQRKALEDQRQREIEVKRQQELQERRQQEIKKRRQREIEEKRQKEIAQLRQKQIEQKRQSNIEKKEIEERRLKDVEEKRLKEIEERRLKEIEEKRLKDIEDKRLGKIKKRRLKEIEEIRLKEIEGRRFKEMEDKTLKEIEERKLNNIQENRLKEIEEKKQLEIEERGHQEFEERRFKKITARRQQQIEENRQMNIEEKRLKQIDERKQLEIEEKRQKEFERKKEIEERGKIYKEEKQLLEEVQQIEEGKDAEDKRQKVIEENTKEEKRRRLIDQRIEQHLQQEMQKKEEERISFLLRLEEERKKEEDRKAEESRKFELAKRLEQEKKKFAGRRRDRIRLEGLEKKIETERHKVISRLKEEDQKEIESRRFQQKIKIQGQREIDKEKESEIEKVDEEIQRQLLDNQKQEDELHRIKIIEENLKNQELHAERERKLQREREELKLEREKLEKQQEELRRQQELLEISKKQQQIQDNLPLQNNPIERECVISPWPDAGNITCVEGELSRGRYNVPHGSLCSLQCYSGFVSLESRQALCSSGSWDHLLQCVRPGAMLLVGGRSDTYGVLSSVELLTSGGVCRGAVPPIPAMRWKMVVATLDRDTVVVCGGINFLGDPKTTCWKLQLGLSAPGFGSMAPNWQEMAGLSVPRDAAAWAAENGSLFVMGGSLGPLSGYTASVEVWSGRRWSVGPSLTSTRASHCAVALGNGSIVVTGGYGALQAVERLDIHSRTWTDLPALNPLRAQHGCALVELNGRRGVMVAGGDSGGTRLNDVRFLPLDQPTKWIQLADLNTARWGRPSIGVIGGRITVVGGWDGVKALSSVEYYEERSDRWETSKVTRLSTERRWAAATQISTKLFPKCVSKRQ